MLKVTLFLFLFFTFAVAAKIDEVLKAIQDISLLFQHDDNGMSHDTIRPKPTEDMARLQRVLCQDVIPVLIELLMAGNDLKVQSEAAQAIGLCANQNSENTEEFGRAKHGLVHSSLAQLIHTSMKVYKNANSKEQQIEATNAIAHAAEALSYLAINNERNQISFLRSGIVNILVDVLEECSVDDFQGSSVCSVAVMWSLTALESLTSIYCHSKDGLCRLEWNKAGDQLVLAEGFIPSIDPNGVSSQFRQAILDKLEHSNLALHLKYFVCNGSSKNPAPNIMLNGESPALIPWAAAALIKNLGISPAIREFWFDEEEFFDCLCYMYRHTKDELEFRKSYLGLYNMDWLRYCTNDYYWCDDKNWYQPETGHNCSTIEEESQCQLTSKYGVPASNACCVCGGGVPPYQNL